MKLYRVQCIDRDTGSTIEIAVRAQSVESAKSRAVAIGALVGQCTPVPRVGMLEYALVTAALISALVFALTLAGGPWILGLSKGAAMRIEVQVSAARNNVALQANAVKSYKDLRKSNSEMAAKLSSEQDRLRIQQEAAESVVDAERKLVAAERDLEKVISETRQFEDAADRRGRAIEAVWTGFFALVFVCVAGLRVGSRLIKLA